MTEKVDLAHQIAEMEKVIAECSMYRMTSRDGLTVAEATERRRRQLGILATLKWLKREQDKKA